MKILAPAKLTLFLTVGRRAGAGLHELTAIMQSVSLWDELTLEAADAFDLAVEPPGSAPADDTNLVARAIRGYATARGVGDGIRARLVKRIPIAAGLGGGSSDAAAALVGMNELAGRPVSRKGLEKIAASLGSDVPFCVRGGTAVVAGTGDELVPLAVATPVWWVLVACDIALRTADVYAEFDRLGGGAIGDPHAVADALARGDLEALAAGVRNDLEPAARSVRPDVAAAREALIAAGALAVVLCGSGSAWAGLARDEPHAHAIAERSGGAVARSLEHGPRVER